MCHIERHHLYIQLLQQQLIDTHIGNSNCA
jgi:hypothetical protein